MSKLNKIKNQTKVPNKPRKIRVQKILNEKEILRFTEFIKDFAPKIIDCPNEELLSEEAILAKAFSRARIITLELLVLIILNFAANTQKKSMSSLILEIWISTSRLDEMPTRQAVSNALGHLSIDKLRLRVLKLSYNGNHHNIKYLNGKKIYCVDGTKNQLPRNSYTIEEFGLQNSGSNPAHYPQAHLVCFIELGTNCVKWFEIGGLKSNEKPLLLKGVDALETGSILMGDCGFHSAGLAWKLSDKSYSYIFRINEKNAVKMVSKLKFVNGEIITTLKITKEMKNTYLEMENAPDEIEVRIIKVKGAEGDKRAIYLMTDLMDVPKKEIADLYFERQRVEDAFKYKKCYGGLEKIHHNSEEQLIGLIIIGVIAYFNMVQLSLSILLPTPSPNENGKFSLNRKIAFENVLAFYFKFLRTKTFDKNLLKTLARTQNKIRTGRSEVRYSKQPINTHIRNRGKIRKQIEKNKKTS